MIRVVFADTVYWMARARPNDPYREAAIRARELLGGVRIVTTDEVFNEFLAALSGGGSYLRQVATRMVRAGLANPNVRVIPQTRNSFLRGLDLYESRLDKGYSLTDCISMVAMKTEAIHEVLTNDHHFTQEGFTVLIPTVRRKA